MKLNMPAKDAMAALRQVPGDFAVLVAESTARVPAIDYDGKTVTLHAAPAKKAAEKSATKAKAKK